LDDSAGCGFFFNDDEEERVLRGVFEEDMMTVVGGKKEKTLKASSPCIYIKAQGRGPIE
jgi:hypothetical protein